MNQNNNNINKNIGNNIKGINGINTGGMTIISIYSDHQNPLSDYR